MVQHFDTWLTRATGVRLPFIQGGMMWVARAELIAAVANAGGLGFLAAFTQPDIPSLRNEIRRTRAMTDKPFGINFTILPTINAPDYVGYAKAAVEEGVTIFEVSGNPKLVYDILRTAKNSVIIHKSVNLAYALKAQALGVDAVAVDGFECGGHPGHEDVSSLILLTRCAQELKIPYIASGGFCDARGCAAAFALGCAAVTMGTRFICMQETPVHQNIKEAMVKASETDTSLILKPLKNSVRCFRNKVSMEVEEIERTDPEYDFSRVKDLMAGTRGYGVFQSGDIDAGIWSCGQATGLIKDIPTCKQFLDRLEHETIALLQSQTSVIRSGASL